MEEAQPVGRDPWEEAAALQAGPQAREFPPRVEELQTTSLSAGRPCPESREKVSRLRAASPRPSPRSVPESEPELKLKEETGPVNTHPQPPLPRS